MKKIGIAVVMCAALGLAGCSKPEPQLKLVERKIYVNVVDTAQLEEKDRIIDSLYTKHARDTVVLRRAVDSLSTELFVANYKLGRIREYNRIAGQRNNIKYLRGWLNRVLNNK